MSLESDVDRGQRAERLMNDPLLIEAFGTVKQAIVDGWESAPIRDVEGHHELKLMMKLLGDVRAHLERAVADGKLAAMELNSRRKLTLAEFRQARYG